MAKASGTLTTASEEARLARAEALAAVKIAYDLTLWCMFRRVKPPEEAVGE